MAKYSSDNITINSPAEKVYEKLSNLDNLQAMLDKVPEDRIPADKREMFQNIKLTSDTIEIPNGPMGTLVFRIVERKAPSLVRLKGEGVPINLELVLHVKPLSAETSEAKVDFDIDIPMMLKPMVGGQIQKVANQFGEVLGAINFE